MIRKMALVKNFISDRDKKKPSQIIKEVTELYKENKEFPIHYFTRLLYKKEAPNYKGFMSVGAYKKFHKKETGLHKKQTITILEDKVLFDDFCQRHNIPTTRTLGCISRGEYTSPEISLQIDSLDKLKILMEDLMKRDAVNHIFLKPRSGVQAKGCYKISRQELETPGSSLHQLLRDLPLSEYILQEVITQHDKIQRINPYSINTIRIDTYIDDEGGVEVLSAMMRFGRKGRVVDNANCGGFFVPLDLSSARLGRFGMQYLHLGNKYIYEHPDTKVQLEGFKVPFVYEVTELVKRAASILGDRLVGWDVAITPSGPILIEGNHDYSIGMQEMAYGGYKNHPVFKSIIKKYI